MREYEWRVEGTGARFTEPKVAINACVFRLQTFASGSVKSISAATADTRRRTGDSNSIVHIYVTKTGERIDSTLSADGERCRLVDHDVWYDINGRIVPAPKELWKGLT